MRRLKAIALTLTLLLWGGVNSLTASAATGGISKTATYCKDGYSEDVLCCRVGWVQGAEWEEIYNAEYDEAPDSVLPPELDGCETCGGEFQWVDGRTRGTDLDGDDYLDEYFKEYEYYCVNGHHREHNYVNTTVGKHTTSGYVIRIDSTRLEHYKHSEARCSHRHSYQHYYDTSYGYDGSSSTFTVYPLTVTANNNISSTLKVSGATATDAALPGKKVTLSLSGAPAGVNYKVTNSATGATQTVASPYSFTMPSEPVTLTVEYALAVNPSPSQINLFVGQESQITPNQQPSTAAVTYTSGNTSIAKVSSTGKITALSKGSTNITVTATA